MAVSTVLAYKCRAAALSLAIFAAFMIVLAVLAARFWYPDYLFWTDGGLQGLRIVLLVDFVLGPVLALVFFHPEKSRGKLVFDIVVISCIQVGAMGWGAWQVWSQRPVAVVYGNHRFVSVAPDIMHRQGETPDSLARLAGGNPPYIYRRQPVTEQEQRRQMVMLLKYGFHPEAQAFLFTPMRDNLDKVFESQAEIRQWLRSELPAAGDVSRVLETPAAYRLAFFEGRYGGALLLFTPAGDYAGYVGMGDRELPYL